MGLDMWFESSSDIPEDVDDVTLTEILHKDPDKYGFTEVKYFRKHADLHGLLSDIWCRKTYEPEFNCSYLEITPEILEDMKMLVRHPPKKHSTGFFWGESTDLDWEDTIDLIGEIEKEFLKGNRVFYHAWW